MRERIPLCLCGHPVQHLGLAAAMLPNKSKLLLASCLRSAAGTPLSHSSLACFVPPWQVTNDILHNEAAGMEAHYFAAQTLRTKVGKLLTCSA